MGVKGAAFSSACKPMTRGVHTLLSCTRGGPCTCNCGSTYATFTHKRSTVCPVKDCTVPRVGSIGPSVGVNSFAFPTGSRRSSGMLGSKVSLRFSIVGTYGGGRTTCRILGCLCSSRAVRVCLSSRNKVTYGSKSFTVPRALGSVHPCVRGGHVTSCRSRRCPDRVDISTVVRAFLLSADSGTRRGFLGGFSSS